MFVEFYRLNLKCCKAHWIVRSEKRLQPVSQKSHLLDPSSSIITSMLSIKLLRVLGDIDTTSLLNTPR